MERGLNHKYQMQYKVFTQPLCLEKEVFTFATATLTDVMAIHVVLILGIIVSSISLLTEKGTLMIRNNYDKRVLTY